MSMPLVAKLAVVGVVITLVAVSFFAEDTLRAGAIALGVLVLAGVAWRLLRRPHASPTSLPAADETDGVSWRGRIAEAFTSLKHKWLLSSQIAQAMQKHFELTSQLDRCMEIAAINTKGGVGRSTVVSNAGAVATNASMMPVLLSDLRTYRGNLAERLGLFRRKEATDRTLGSTPSVLQAIDLMNMSRLTTAIQTYGWFGRFVGQGHLNALASNIRKMNIPAKDARRLFDLLSGYYSIILHESSNNTLDPLDLELMRRSDVIWAVARPSFPYANDELTATLEDYRSYHDGVFTSKLRDYSVLLVLATRRSDKPEQYATQFGYPLERVIMVPWGAYFVQPEEATDDTAGTASPAYVAIINLNKMPKPAMLAYLNALNLSIELVMERRPPQISVESVLTPEGHPYEDEDLSHPTPPSASS